MAKILKNTTGSVVSLVKLGLDVPASSQITVDINDYILLASDDSVTELTTLINSGDIVVNDGTQDLIVSNGVSLSRAIDFIKYPDTAFNIRFLSDPERVNGYSSKNIQEAIEESRTSFEGKGFQTAFVANGTVANEWMKTEDANILSHHSPDIFKFDAKCVGIDFTNANRNVDPIIIICISNAGSGNDLDRFYKWTLVNKRVASYVDQVNGFTVNAGDKMAIYVRDGGQNSNDVVITMDFIVTGVTDQEISENYNGDFDSGDIPATGSITEIFT